MIVLAFPSRRVVPHPPCFERAVRVNAPAHFCKAYACDRCGVLPCVCVRLGFVVSKIPVFVLSNGVVYVCSSFPAESRPVHKNFGAIGVASRNKHRWYPHEYGQSSPTLVQRGVFPRGVDKFSNLDNDVHFPTNRNFQTHDRKPFERPATKRRSRANLFRLRSIWRNAGNRNEKRRGRFCPTQKRGAA